MSPAAWLFVQTSIQVNNYEISIRLYYYPSMVLQLACLVVISSVWVLRA